MQNASMALTKMRSSWVKLCTFASSPDRAAHILSSCGFNSSASKCLGNDDTPKARAQPTRHLKALLGDFPKTLASKDGRRPGIEARYPWKPILAMFREYLSRNPPQPRFGGPDSM